MSVLEKNHFLVRKLHSLFGVIPIGLFLLEHLYTNSFATQGAEAFNSKVEFLQSLSYVLYIELFLILLPILFHALYGLYIVYVAKNNILKYTYYRNWAFYLQRISALITLVFVVYHLWVLRISAFLTGHEVTFAVMTQHLANPLMFAFYVIGLTAATYHFANGLWAFLVSWGITIGPKAQRISAYVSAFIFVVLTVMGLQALFAFVA
ncbi:succinate dehydrogenase cytochrome b558 subunit [Metallumcola ferriviriculae]|uniref:Succinate dehydrogenase cytochrome b558 subunit n=1 Tax=Metallumcola ferriviriculae TaxID=3039180 RepID=A0AAU0UQA7_9FIRM|nr:succinate dehydrogenase cytochrome b558 subunit [Desulfitibacteraceae bacterium MK1]